MSWDPRGFESRSAGEHLSGACAAQGAAYLEDVGTTRQTCHVAEPIPEAEAFIDYKLTEMASRNEHHEFEEIATRIARKRISSNILIANGPVSAGGDQQRDAESYTTRIPEELPHSAGFSASASTKPTVIACTVQQPPLKAKVLADLAGICAEDADPVEHIAFFSVHSIPAAAIHDLKKTARDDYGITLDIFSGRAIPTLLAEPDLVWVAQQYLDLPSSMIPPLDEEESAPEWYSELLENLRANKGPAALTPATQGEVTHGIRHATWDAETNGDLPEWLDFMGAFLNHKDDGDDSELVFRACYEMAVARWRGMGEATGLEPLIKRAITIARNSNHQNVIDDAVTLASYWGVMWSAGRAEASADEIGEALQGLRDHAIALLDVTDPVTYPIRASTLTGTLAYSYLIPDWRVVDAKSGKPAKIDITPTIGVKMENFDVDITSLAPGAVDFDNAMTYFDRLIDLLPEARAYSASSLATVFDLFTPAVVDHPKYAKVRDGLDEAATRVQGESALAERFRDRSTALMKAGKPLEALAELHQAKINWFNGDTLYGALLTMRYIAKIYEDLGLTYAAKMYACSAASIALVAGDSDDKEHLPKALLEAAHYAQHAGTWADAAGLTEVALLARGQYLPDPFDFEKYPDLHAQRITQGLGVNAVRKYWPELEAVIKEAHWRTDWYEMIDEMVTEVGAEYTMTEDEFQDEAAKQLAGPVFADLGPERVLDFCALGVRWIFSFTNDKTTVLTAEGLCAAFQVFVADIARQHPVLINSTLYIDVDVVDDAGHEVDDFDVDDDEPELRAHVTISSAVDDQDAHAASLVSFCFQLIQTVHAGSLDDLTATMEPMYKAGLPHKVVLGRSYQDAADLLKPEHFARCAAAKRPTSSSSYAPTSHPALGPSTEPGNRYDHDQSLAAVRSRYESVYDLMRYTYPRLLADEGIRATIQRLQGEGWLDWQILATLANMKWNWRLRNAGMLPGVGDPKEALKLAREPETQDSPVVPLEWFNDAEITFNLTVQTSVIAQTWGVVGRAEVAGEDAMRDLLARRYGYATDDIPHRDILNCLDENGELLPLVEAEPEHAVEGPG